MGTEDAIRAALDRGDHSEAVRVAIEGHGAELLSFLSAIHGNREQASEVFAQTCEDLLRTLPKFRRECSFRTWMYAVARNASRRHRDEQERHRHVGLSEAPEIEQLVRSTTAAFLKTEWKERFRALRDSLEPDDRALLVLRVDRQMAWSDICEVFDGQASARRTVALRKRFERIKQDLRARAVDSGWWTEGS